MGIAGTIALPGRSAPAVPARRGPELPQWLPGGFGQPTGLPSQLLQPVYPPRGGRVGSRHKGQVRLFQPCIDKQAPYLIGANTGFSVASIDGRPITWLHRWFTNIAGLSDFLPYNLTDVDWTSNTNRGAARGPAVPVPFGLPPFGRKRLNAQGGYQRPFNVDNQLFTSAMVVPHSPAPTRTYRGGWTWRGRAGWPIQKPLPKNIRTQMLQGPQRPPWFPKLTRMEPAASYGQTTTTLLSNALTNLLPTTIGNRNPQTLQGTPYGAY